MKFILRSVVFLIVPFVSHAAVSADKMTNGHWTSQRHHNIFINDQYYLTGKQERRVVLLFDNMEVVSEGESLKSTPYTFKDFHERKKFSIQKNYVQRRSE